MKRFLPTTAFALCVLLMLFSTPALSAAQDALLLWWRAVLPTLFPFFVCTSIMERTGALHALARLFAPLAKRLSISAYALPVLLLSSISGYPSGARLCGMLLKKHTISAAQAQRLGTCCNLCSPIFLMGVLSQGMLGNPALFGVLCLGHYASALLILLAQRVFRPIAPEPSPHAPQNPEPLRLALPAAIGEGMSGLIRVGGCIVFFLVLASLLQEIGALAALSLPFSLLCAELGRAMPGFLCGLLEFTGGCHMLALADISMRLRASLCAFLVSFGGLCVMVQAMAFLAYPCPYRYILTKLLHGVLAGVLIWVVFPYLPGDAAVMALPSGISPYARNALTGLSLLLASLLGVAVASVLAALGGLLRGKQG